MYTPNDILLPNILSQLDTIKSNKTTDIFTSTEKDITISITKRKPIFSSGYNYVFNFKFTNNIGVNLIELLLTDIDISILLDNIDFMLQSNQDFVMKTTSLSSSTVGDTFISIYCENVYVNEYTITPRYFFKVFSYSNEEMKKILSFDITDNLEEFYNLLQLIIF